MGKFCEIEKNDCQPNPCLNGGTCTRPTKCGYQCLCTQSFKGINCTDKEIILPSTTTLPQNQLLFNYPQEIVDYGTPENVNFFNYYSCIYQSWSIANPPSNYQLIF